MLTLKNLALSASMFMASIAFAGHHEASEKQTIVDVAVGAGSFETLVTALKAADLVNTLKSDGPFTMFAPTDDAFAALPEGTLDALLKDPTQLANILTLHVVAGQANAADVVGLTSVTSLQGKELAISTDGGVAVAGANVVQADIGASNGVIHVIDKVILP